MGTQISTHEVKKYLVRIKTAISEGRYQFIQRRKNMESLSKVGLLVDHVKEILLGLTYSDYFNGPEPEDDEDYEPGEYLFFGCDVHENEFFVKFKLEQLIDNEKCICLSFHIAEKKIYYPYK